MSDRERISARPGLAASLFRLFHIPIRAIMRCRHRFAKRFSQPSCATSGLPVLSRSSSIFSVGNIVAHPPGGLFLLAKETAESFSRKMPPIRPLASRATQKPSMLRPMKNAGIVPLTVPGSSGRNCAVMAAGASVHEMPVCSLFRATSAGERSGACPGEKSGFLNSTTINAPLWIACREGVADECARPALPRAASGCR